MGDKIGLVTGLNFSSRAGRDGRSSESLRGCACPTVAGRPRVKSKNRDGTLRGDFPADSRGDCGGIGGVVGRGSDSGTEIGLVTSSVRPGGSGGIDSAVDAGESVGCKGCDGSGCGTGWVVGSGLVDRGPRPERSTSTAW